MKTTILHTDHLAQGAKMGPFAGWDMPLQYAGVKQEVMAVRQSVGMFDVSHMGEFWVKGPDAVTFIDGLITNDFANAPLGKAVYSPLCREDGGVIDDLIVYKMAEQEVLVCVNASNIEKDWQWFESHIQGKKISLTNHSDETALVAVQGPRAAEILSTFQIDTSLESFSVAHTESAFGPIIMARTGYTGEDGFEIFCNLEQAPQLWRALLEKDVQPCGLAARDVLRLEACFPLYGHELSDEWTPLDAGLKWTVKDSKEKFVGKEALSAYKPRYRLIKIVLDRGIPRDDYAIKTREGVTIGRVTSGTMSVTLGKGVALGLVDAQQAPKAGDTVLITIRNQDYPATVVKEAFLKGGRN